MRASLEDIRWNVSFYSSSFWVSLTDITTRPVEHDSLYILVFTVSISHPSKYIVPIASFYPSQELSTFEQ